MSSGTGTGDPGDPGGKARVRPSAPDDAGGTEDGGSGWTAVTRRVRQARKEALPTQLPQARSQRDSERGQADPLQNRRRPNPPSLRRNQRTTPLPCLPPSGTPPINWRTVCFASKCPDDSRKLCYTPPKIADGRKIAVLDNEDSLKAKEKWNLTITGYIMGKRPFFPHLKANVERQWKIKGKIDIFTRERGFFIFKLSQEEDYKHILEDRPWFFDGRLMILKPWNASNGLDRELLNSVPTWIQLPGLNLQAWTLSSIGKIASTIGTPILLDQKTANGTRMEYARCLIEIQATDEQPSSVTIELEDGYTYEQPIIYEWLPKKCVNCVSFDHTSSECSSPARPEDPALPQWQIKHREVTTAVEAQTSREQAQQPVVLERNTLGKAGQSTGDGILIDSMVVCSPTVCKKAPQKEDQRQVSDTVMEDATRSTKGKNLIQEKQDSKGQKLSILPNPPRHFDQEMSEARSQLQYQSSKHLKVPTEGKLDSQELLQPQTPIELEDLLDHLDSEMDLDFSLRGSSAKILSNSNSPPQEESPHSLLETAKPFPNWSFSSSDQENNPSFTVSNPNWSIEQIQLQHHKELEELGPKRKEKRKHKPRPPYSSKNQLPDQASTATPTKSLEF